MTAQSLTTRAGQAVHILFLIAFSATLLVGGGGPHSPETLSWLSLAGGVLLGLAVAAHVTQVRPISTDHVTVAMLLLGLLLLPLIQLLPLVAGDPCAGTFRRAACGVSSAASAGALSTPSLDPAATRLFVANLMMPVALLFGMLGENGRGMRRWAWVALAVAGLGVTVGLFQFTAPAGALDIFGLDAGYAGLFANANHHGMAMMIAAIVVAGFAPRSRRPLTDPAWLAVGVLLLSALGSGSRTSALLLPLLAVILAWVRLPASFRVLIVALIVGAALFALLWWIVPEDNAAGLHDEFAGWQDDRIQRLPLLVGMAGTALPWGVGFGAFRDAWPIVEPLRSIDGMLLNHAHMDWLQWVIEGGVPALFWIVAALAAITVAIRRGAQRGLAERRSWRTGVSVIAMVGLFSLVDYPLRTQALLATTLMALRFVLSDAQAEGKLPRPRWALVAGSAALFLSLGSGVAAWRLLQARAAVDRLDVTDALRLAPDDPRVLELEAGLALKHGKPDAALAPAAQAAAASPLNPTSVRTLALARELTSAPSADDWRAAASLGWNEPFAQLAAMLDAAGRERWTMAAMRADALLRVYPRPPYALQQVRQMVRASRPFRAAFLQRIDENSPWRASLLAPFDPADKSAMDTSLLLLEALAARGEPLQASEWAPVFDALVKAGAAERAATLAVRMGMKPVANGALPFNVMTDQQSMNPFDWKRSRDPDIDVRGTGDGAGIASNAFSKGRALSRWIVVPPSGVQFSLESDDAADDGVLRLVVECPGHRPSSSPRPGRQVVTAAGQCGVALLAIDVLPDDRPRSLRIAGISARTIEANH